MNDVVVSAYHITPTKFDLQAVYLVLRFYGGIGIYEQQDPQTVSYTHLTLPTTERV